MITKKTKGKYKGKWQVRIQPLNPVTKKRESWLVQYAATKAKAVAIERRMWADYENGLNLGDGNSIFAEEIAKYVDTRKNVVSEVTQKDWDYTVKICKQYFNKAKIRDINQQVMSKFAHDFVRDHHTKVGKTTVIARRLTHIRKFFKSIEGKSILTNPVPERFLQCFFQKKDFSVGKELYIFSNYELEKIKDEIRLELKASPINNWGTKLAIWIDLETGMRPGELQALKFNNLTEKDGFPTFKISDSWSDYTKAFNGNLKSRPQGAYRYCLPISSELANTFNEYSKKQADFLMRHRIKNPEGLVFINLHDYKAASNDIPITQRSMNLMLKSLCKKLGIKNENAQLSMYSFRHTVCTKLANKPGMSYPWAAERMGHSLSMFMKTYVKTDMDVDKQMMEKWLN